MICHGIPDYKAPEKEGILPFVVAVQKSHHSRSIDSLIFLTCIVTCLEAKSDTSKSHNRLILKPNIGI